MKYRYWFHYAFSVTDGMQTTKFAGRIQIYRNHPIVGIEDLQTVEDYIQSKLPVGATPVDVDNFKLLAYRDNEFAEWTPVLS